MKLGANLQDSFNDQINAELASAYLYLSMAAYFEDENLPGFAHWMRMQNGRGDGACDALLRLRA